MRGFHEQNRKAWNEAMRLDDRNRERRVAALRAAGSTLYAAEIDDLGDLRSTRVLHLQCNDGRDSLSLARLGAQVTGVDISDEAIACAQSLSQQLGIPAEFVRMDVLHFRLDGRPPYDIVYATRGVLCWIGDPRRWMEAAAGALRRDGFFLPDGLPSVPLTFTLRADKV